MATEKIKIVIVDDEQDLCFLLSDMLTGLGYEVNSFFTLESGMAGIQALKPDWVVLDNNLPDGLGWAKTDDILSIIPGINVIKISANPDSHRNYYKSHVHYLIKPIDVNSIIAFISNTQAAS